MTDYSFLTIWQLDAPVDRVWQAIADTAQYPAWWKYVASVEDLGPGHERGIGHAERYRWKTSLPYSIVFETRVTRFDPPHLLEAVAIGELAGFGRWELSEDSGRTTVRYTWNVRTTKRWMNLLAPLARPAFAWNHDVLMREGGEGLARRLGARLLRNESHDVSAPSGNSTGALLGGLILGAGTIVAARRVFRRR